MIRAARPDDAIGIATTHVLSWQSAYRGLLPDDLLDSLDAEARARRWRAGLGEPHARGSTVLVAEDGRDVIGFCATCPTRDSDEDPATVGEVAAIYVRPDAWGSGVGRHLMRDAVESLAADGYTAATLWVLAGNDRAVRFYEAAGWTADGATKLDTLGGAPVTELRYRSRPLHTTAPHPV